MIVASKQIKEVDISKQAHALKFLRITDYTLIFVCGPWLLRSLMGLVVSPEVREGEQWIILLVIIAILSFSVYIGYSHIGVINSRLWWAYIIVFPMLLLVCVVLAATWIFIILINAGIILADTGGQKPPDKQELEDLLTFLVMSFWIAASTIFGFVSVLILRRMRIASLGIALVELLSNLKTRSGLRAKGVEKINTDVGIGLGAVGGAIILAGIILPLSYFSRWAIDLVGFFFLLRARRYFQASPDSLLAIDKRSPILLLRSFDDDKTSLSLFPDSDLLDFSLETRLSNHFSHFGPFIAIGSPRDPLPQPGPTQIFLSDNEWQTKVISWISEASLIIIHPGKTQWINWELARVIEMERVRDLILLIPETKKGLLYEDIAPRMGYVRDVFNNTRWSGTLAAFQDVQNLRAMLFRDDGSIIVIKSQQFNRDSYHLAALVAHYILLDQAAASPS